MIKTVEEARKRLGEDSFPVHDWQHGSEHGYPPAYREIGTAFGYTGRGAYNHIRALVKKGYIEYQEGRPRTLKVVQAEDKTRIIRVKADIPACSIKKGDYVHVEGGKVVGITRNIE